MWRGDGFLTPLKCATGTKTVKVPKVERTLLLVPSPPSILTVGCHHSFLFFLWKYHKLVTPLHMLTTDGIKNLDRCDLFLGQLTMVLLGAINQPNSFYIGAWCTSLYGDFWPQVVKNLTELVILGCHNKSRSNKQPPFFFLPKGGILYHSISGFMTFCF